jgi:hypothetical protein
MMETDENIERKIQRIVVLDMDETLGCFVELGMFWDGINSILGEKSEEHFFDIIDLFPMFLRPHIMYILKYLLKKRKTMECDNIIMYTNNQGPKSWPLLISKYFNSKLKTTIFDRVIAAYKVGGKIIESCRTTHDKTISDLFNCVEFKYDTTRVCFLDDQYHPAMRDNNVDYIFIKPYNYSMDYNEMADKYYDRFTIDIELDKNEFNKRIISYMNDINYNVRSKKEEEYLVDVIVSKKILEHLEEFFTN